MADKSWDDIIADAGDDFNIPPEGKYQAVIKTAESTVSRSGNQMVSCGITIAEGPHARKFIKTVHISKPGPGTAPDKAEGAARMFLRHLKALGITIETLKQHNPTMDQIAAVAVGKPVTVNVKHAEWNGNVQAEHQGPLMAPASGAVEVTSFPPVGTQVLSSGAPMAAGYDADPGF
jgi:hypothetical protein